MTSRERHGKTSQDAIRRVLLDKWDPIGVREVPEAQDEYDGYVGGVYRLLTTGVSVPELAEHLVRIERDSMGLSARSQACVDVASLLKQIAIASRSA